jgi:hypothetical protein
MTDAARGINFRAGANSGKKATRGGTLGFSPPPPLIPYFSLSLLYPRSFLSRSLSLRCSPSESRIETRVRLHQISHLHLMYARLCTFSCRANEVLPADRVLDPDYQRCQHVRVRLPNAPTPGADTQASLALVRPHSATLGSLDLVPCQRTTIPSPLRPAHRAPIEHPRLPSLPLPRPRHIVLSP